MNTPFEEYQKEYILESLVYNSIDTVLAQYEIKKAPQKGDLKACLECYTKDKLIQLSDENGFHARRTWKKAELVDFIGNKIMEKLELRLLILGKRKLILFQKLINGEFREETARLEEGEFYMMVYPSLVRMGLLLAMREDDGLTNAIPGDVKETLDKVIENFTQMEGKYAQELEYFYEIEGLLDAAIHLYGVVTAKTVHQLWMIENSDKEISTTQIQQFLDYSDYFLPLVVMKNGYYHIDKYLIASELFEDEEEVRTFEANLPSQKEIYTHKPTKQEIEFYKNDSFDHRTKYYKRLEQFLAKHHPKIITNSLMTFIGNNIQLGNSLSEIVDDLYYNSMLQLDTDDDYDEFARLFRDLRKHSRLWQLIGNTSEEIYKKMRILEDTIDSMPKILRDNDKNPANNHKKVGRNDPCPCGSGKKYKKCCMRKDKLNK